MSLEIRVLPKDTDRQTDRLCLPMEDNVDSDYLPLKPKHLIFNILAMSKDLWGPHSHCH